MHLYGNAFGPKLSFVEIQIFKPFGVYYKPQKSAFAFRNKDCTGGILKAYEPKV